MKRKLIRILKKPLKACVANRNCRTCSFEGEKIVCGYAGELDQIADELAGYIAGELAKKSVSTKITPK